MDEFRGIVLPGRQSIRVLDPSGSVLYEKLDHGTGVRPEAQRGELRQILLDALPAGTVRWGHKVVAAQPVGQDRHEVTFTDGRTVVTSLLVGADGAWSQVRPLLSDATPHYTGLSFVETYLYDVESRQPATAKAVGGGTMVAQPVPVPDLHRQSERGQCPHPAQAAQPPHQRGVLARGGHRGDRGVEPIPPRHGGQHGVVGDVERHSQRRRGEHRGAALGA
jgi:2-polyprenyl-6-methoxyphenol hydroxylase-like FAD-dependent oxidoreductase